jgi:hypothetical protein
VYTGNVARMGAKRNTYWFLVEKLEGRRPVGRPRRSYMANIKIDPLEIGCDSVDWGSSTNVGQGEHV